MVFGKFVAYFQPEQKSITSRDALLYASGIIGLKLLQILFENNLAQLVTEYSMKIRTAVSSLIFRKALKISPLELSNISIGKIVTLLAKDVYSIDGGVTFLKDTVIGVLYILVVTYTLYQKVGVSSFPATGVILVLIPLQLYLGKKTTLSRIETAKRTDERFRLIQETLNAVKTIKMYVWENYFEKLIGIARLKETDKLKVVYYLKSIIVILGASTLNLSFYVLLISYIARGYPLKAEVIYFVQQSLFTLRAYIAMSIPLGIGQTADMIGSMRRIQQFLESKEYHRENITMPSPNEHPVVYLNQVSVTFKKKQILKSVSLNIKEGLILITGNNGSGKSSLLKTILGEYPVSNGEKKVTGSISYAPEEPWLFPSTIKQNILFGQAFDKKRYEEVLSVCALTYDINQFEKGDYTIVGDKGINLSKGQQARVTLARAIYRNSDVYLLDDCLSSLDNHVNKHIFEKCIKGYLKDKICILISNNLSNINSVPTGNILLIENGSTLTLEQQAGALDKRITYYIDEETERFKRESYLLDDFEESDDEVDETDTLLQNKKVADREINLYHETKKEGGVLWSNYVRYFKFIGGYFRIGLLFVIFISSQACLSYSEKIISLWVNLEPKVTKMLENNQTNSTEYLGIVGQRNTYLNIYSMMIIGIFVFFMLRAFTTFTFCMNGAKKMHRAVVKAMLNTNMYFFDTHFIGNIINRLSKDFHSIDEYMPFLVLEYIRSIFSVLGVLILVGTVNISFFIPAGLLLVKLYFVQKFYLPTSRSLRRLESSTRSPIIGYLNSTLEGVAIARASQKEGLLKIEFDGHQDLYTSVFYMNQTTGKFFGLILDFFGIFFVVGIMAKITFFGEHLGAGDVGLAISQAMMLSGVLQYIIRQLTEIESVMTAIERVLEYADVELEPKTGRVLEIANWPIEGNIVYKNLTLKYKNDDNIVLKDLSFDILGKTKIGIVGRTGAGKSSIISTLFRLYDYEGNIFIDNENIKTLSLEYLRSIISIIPQDPVLFSGSIRSNIDPLSKYTDTAIWAVLAKVHAKHLVKDLNQNVTDCNYSSGQKQLFCLARALIRGNKIVVMDEATANLDPETDKLLQESVRQCFEECTVIIIAHRLNSVMKCDKVLVLDAGQIVEFDEPEVLLKNRNGFLYKMVRDEGPL
ncbi:multidrug resistance-associated protein 4-like isoform X2 [Sitophilus oryzae]|nr:multidrug resistance-associated protein 4-like isoform X2 [Sitophilus oryzae]